MVSSTPSPNDPPFFECDSSLKRGSIVLPSRCRACMLFTTRFRLIVSRKRKEYGSCAACFSEAVVAGGFCGRRGNSSSAVDAGPRLTAHLFVVPFSLSQCSDPDARVHLCIADCYSTAERIFGFLSAFGGLVCRGFGAGALLSNCCASLPFLSSVFETALDWYRILSIMTMDILNGKFYVSFTLYCTICGISVDRE